MADLYQNKNIKTLIVPALRRQHVQVELEDSIIITYDILDHIFQTVKYWILMKFHKAINTMLGFSIAKK